jgi:hypothetical protein
MNPQTSRPLLASSIVPAAESQEKPFQDEVIDDRSGESLQQHTTHFE